MNVSGFIGSVRYEIERALVNDNKACLHGKINKWAFSKVSTDYNKVQRTALNIAKGVLGIIAHVFALVPTVAGGLYFGARNSWDGASKQISKLWSKIHAPKEAVDKPATGPQVGETRVGSVRNFVGNVLFRKNTGKKSEDQWKVFIQANPDLKTVDYNKVRMDFDNAEVGDKTFLDWLKEQNTERLVNLA